MTIALIRTNATYSELSVAPESLSSVFFLQHSTHSVMCPSHGSHLDNNYLSSCSLGSLAVAQEELKSMSDSQKRYMSWKSWTRPWHHFAILCSFVGGLVCRRVNPTKVSVKSTRCTQPFTSGRSIKNSFGVQHSWCTTQGKAKGVCQKKGGIPIDIPRRYINE